MSVRYWLITLLIALCTLPLLAIAISFANRPAWRTYTSPSTGGTKYVLSVQMPDTWTADAWVANICVGFHEHSHQGLVGWIYKYVLHDKSKTWASDSVDFYYGVPQDKMKSIAMARKLLSDPNEPVPATPNSIREFVTPFGRAIEWQEALEGKDEVREAIIVYPNDLAVSQDNTCFLEFVGQKSHLDRIHSTLIEATRRMRLIPNTASNLNQ